MSDLVDQPATRSTAFSADERQELQRLREEVASLRAEPAAPGREHVRWASVGAAVLVVLGCLSCRRRSIAWLRRGRIAEVLQNGPVGPWVHAHRRLRQGGVVILAVIFVIVLDQPTGLAILSVAIALVVLLAMIEFLNRPAPRAAPSVAPSMTAGSAPPNAMS